MNERETLLSQKKNLRKLLLERVSGLSPSQMELDSARILKRIFSLDAWDSAQSVLLFCPMPGEPQIFETIPTAFAQKKRICLPRWTGSSYEIAEIGNPHEDLVLRHYKIREPSPNCPTVGGKQLDLVLVPGVAWTHLGDRMGRGRGYYDRLLATCGGLHCGVGWNEQVVDAMPTEPHDRKVHMLITPNGVWRGGRKISD